MNRRQFLKKALYGSGLIMLPSGLLVPKADAWGIATFHAQQPAAAAASGECDGALLCQNLENASGYDNSETWTPSETVDPNETTLALRGTYSLEMGSTAGAGGSVVSPTFSANLNVYFHCLVYFNGAVFDAVNDFILFRNGSAVNQLKFRLSATNIYIYCGDTYKADVAHGMSADTMYHIWVTRTSNGSSSSSAAVYIGTTTSRPGSPTTSFTDQTNAFDTITDVRLVHRSQVSATTIMDQILLKTSDFSTVDA